MKTGEGDGAVNDDEADQDPQHADGDSVDAVGGGRLGGGGETGDEGETGLAEGEHSFTGVARGFTGHGCPWPGNQARNLSGTGEEHGSGALDGIGGVGVREELAGEGVFAGDGVYQLGRGKGDGESRKKCGDRGELIGGDYGVVCRGRQDGGGMGCAVGHCGGGVARGEGWWLPSLCVAKVSVRVVAR